MCFRHPPSLEEGSRKFIQCLEKPGRAVRREATAEAPAAVVQRSCRAPGKKRAGGLKSKSKGEGARPPTRRMSARRREYGQQGHLPPGLEDGGHQTKTSYATTPPFSWANPHTSTLFSLPLPPSPPSTSSFSLISPPSPPSLLSSRHLLSSGSFPILPGLLLLPLPPSSISTLHRLLSKTDNLKNLSRNGKTPPPPDDPSASGSSVVQINRGNPLNASRSK